MVNYTDTVGGKKKQTNKQKKDDSKTSTKKKKGTKNIPLECNSNNNNNSTGTDGRWHSVDDEAELVQNDEISKSTVIT